MSNPFDDMRYVVAQAEQTLKAADDSAKFMASMLRGRLKHVSPWVLIDLKKELTNFDAHKKVWK